MKVIVAGSRRGVSRWTVYGAIDDTIELLPKDPGITKIVCGCAIGVDTFGRDFGYAHNISVMEFPADLERHGRAAGHLRNAEMADYADALILVWDGESRGSANMREQMIQRGKPIFEVIVRKIGTWPTAI